MKKGKVSRLLVIYSSFLKGCNTVCQKECLDLHNLYRKNHRAMPLKLDKQLMKQADKWANNNVTRSTSGWVAKGGGECWAWGTMYTSWKKVIKVNYSICSKHEEIDRSPSMLGFWIIPRIYYDLK